MSRNVPTCSRCVGFLVCFVGFLVFMALFVRYHCFDVLEAFRRKPSPWISPGSSTIEPETPRCRPSEIDGHTAMGRPIGSAASSAAWGACRHGAKAPRPILGIPSAWLAGNQRASAASELLRQTRRVCHAHLSYDPATRSGTRKGAGSWHTR